MILRPSCKNKNIVLIFLSELLSSFGSGMAYIGINWYIFSITASSTMVSFYMITFITGAMIFLPIAGFYSDRFNRKKIVYRCHLYRGLFFILYVFVTLIWKTEFYFIFSIAFISGAGWAFYMPASRALVQESLSESEYTKVNSFLEVALQVGNLGSAALCGFLLFFFDIKIIIFINSLMFLMSWLLILAYQEKKNQTIQDQNQFFKQLLEGIIYQKSKPYFPLLGLALSLPFAVTIASNVILPVRNHNI